MDSHGITFCGVLTIIFIVLKIIGIINWSWWVVLCPVLIESGVTITAVIITVAICMKKGIL